MYKIRHNRLLSILEKLDDKSYYLSSVAFSMLAERKWKEEKHRHPVSHGYRHISNIISFIEIILYHMSDEEVLNYIDEKYIFILLASVYIHDLGMQYYYDDNFNELKDIAHDDLSPQQWRLIRSDHSGTIRKKIESLKTNTLSNFFEDDYTIIVEMHKMSNLDIKKGPILNCKSHIALVASHHNKTLNHLKKEVNILNENKKLILDENEYSKIELVTSLLQFSDALDMSIERVDEELFKNMLLKIRNNDNVASSAEKEDLDRIVNCFIIDKIDAVGGSTDSGKRTMEFSLDMSAAQANLQDYPQEFVKLKKKYKKRLDEREVACRQIISKKLNINLHVEFNKSIKNNADKMIDDNFFTMSISDEKTIKELISNRMDKLKEDCEYSYVKLYSGITDVFFGGFSRRLGDNADEIDKLCFYENEWNLKGYINQGCGVIQYDKNFFPKNRFSEYNILTKLARELPGAFYYVIKDDDNIVGFIRAYYPYKITQDLEKEKKTKYNELMKDLGKEIINLHREIYVNKFRNIISKVSFFKNERRLKNNFIELYTDMYLYDEYLNDAWVRDLSIKELKKLIGDTSNLEYDSEYSVKLNKRLFTKIFEIFTTQYENKTEQDLIRTITHEKNKCYVIYSVKMQVGNLIDDVNSLIKYLNEEDLMNIQINDMNDSTINEKEAEYAFVLKAFFILFAAKIFAQYDEKEDSLVIDILLPKRKIEKKPEMNIPIDKLVSGQKSLLGM